MIKPAKELRYIEANDLKDLTQSLLALTILCRGESISDPVSKIDRIRQIDSIFDDSYLLDQLFKSGSIPELAEHVLLDRL